MANRQKIGRFEELLWVAAWVANAGSLRTEQRTEQLVDQSLCCTVTTAGFPLWAGVDDDACCEVTDLFAAL